MPSIDKSGKLMKLDRSVIKILKYDKEDDDDYVKGDISTRFEMVSEITNGIIALQGNRNVKPRLQRDVVHIVKISKGDLIKNKLSTGRAKDVEDANKLKKHHN